MARANNNLAIENADIRFRNFQGMEGRFNPKGSRNFCVMLDPNVAESLKDQGWNVRYLKPRDPEEDEQPYIQVSVRFDNFPPKIVLVSSRGKTILDEESVGSLDWAELDTVDLIIRPYHWNAQGKSGVKGYLNTMYATIVEDPFENKYFGTPDDAQNTIGGCGNCDECDGSCHK